MKNLKIQKANQPDVGKIPVADSDRDIGPEYPYGLEIRLDEDTLKALGITDLPKVGDKMILAAKAFVSSTSQNENANGDLYRSMGLQITDLEFSPEVEKKAAKEVMYDKVDDGK